jgi:uncharacterized membrane protein YkvA (DUF1232 family)
MISPIRLSGGVSHVRAQAASIQRQIQVIMLVLRDPQTPWYCKMVAAGAVGYNLSPVTLIPDWIPVLGLLDNILVLGAGVWLVEKLAPAQVMGECRKHAAREPTASKRAHPLMVKAVMGGVVAVKVVLALVFTGALVAVLRHV